ncbi:MAG: [NiFe]-hydrogenase assembly chaperone HybE [Gammaproteobacteria bacterium]|nr:[NiFe]-hydrogenase assembly chaperone HybE [Gammaproteobacteria bacterium]
MTKNAIKQALEAHFNDILDLHMAGMSVVNPALRVEATGFRTLQEGLLCVLITPWFMSLILFPQNAEASSDGEVHERDFPAGRYEFTSASDEQLGRYESCPLFTPMFEFDSHEQAVRVADTIIHSLMTEKPDKEPSRVSDAPSRRDLFRAFARRARDA